MIGDEIQKRLTALKQAADDFKQVVFHIDGNYEARLSEIRALEMKRDKMKEEILETQRKAQGVLSQASEEAAKVRNDAKRLLDQAVQAKSEAQKDLEESARQVAEAKALLAQANDKQKSADREWHILEERRKKIAEAVR